MLLQLENTTEANLQKLLDYAKQLNLHLKPVNWDEGNSALPGKPLSESVLESMIESGRKSGVVSMENAHDLIRKNFHAD
jgi:hypothetical protein